MLMGVSCVVLIIIFSSSLVRLHNEIARAMPQIIDDGPKPTLAPTERDAYMLSLGLPFLQMFQLQVRRLVYAGNFLKLC